MAVLWFHRTVSLFVRKSQVFFLNIKYLKKKKLFVLYLQLFPKFEIGSKKNPQKTNSPDSGIQANSN